MRPGEDENLHSGRESCFTFFYLFRLSTNWMVPTHTGEDRTALLSSPIQLLTSSGTLLQTHPDQMFYQLSGHPR